jgi:LysM repeat protein
VKPGETLGAIAKKYHTSTAALMKSNGLRRAKILPGQSLIVAGSKRVPVKAAAKATTKTPAPPAKAKHPAKKKKSRPKKKQA